MHLFSQGGKQIYYYVFFTINYDKNRTGIVSSEGKVWQDNRRFALTNLKDLGLGKSRLEDTIMMEVSALLEQLDKKLDKPCELSWIINVAVLNIIWGMIACKLI